jgi:hypothetical protein
VTARKGVQQAPHPARPPRKARDHGIPAVRRARRWSRATRLTRCKPISCRTQRHHPQAARRHGWHGHLPGRSPDADEPGLHHRDPEQAMGLQSHHGPALCARDHPGRQAHPHHRRRSPCPSAWRASRRAPRCAATWPLAAWAWRSRCPTATASHCRGAFGPVLAARGLLLVGAGRDRRPPDRDQRDQPHMFSGDLRSRPALTCRRMFVDGAGGCASRLKSTCAIRQVLCRDDPLSCRRPALPQSGRRRALQPGPCVRHLDELSNEIASFPASNGHCLLSIEDFNQAGAPLTNTR